MCVPSNKNFIYEGNMLTLLQEFHTSEQFFQPLQLAEMYFRISLTYTKYMDFFIYRIGRELAWLSYVWGV